MTTTESSRTQADQSALADKATADANRVKHSAAAKADEVKAQGEAKADEVKAKASEAVDGAKADADQRLNDASKPVDDFSQAVDAAAEQLSDQDRESLAGYARQLSGSIGELAENLQSKSIDDLANDAKALARNNPNGFLLGSIALGFGLSRFAKASGSRHTTSPGSTHSDNDTEGLNQTPETTAPSQQSGATGTPEAHLTSTNPSMPMQSASAGKPTSGTSL